MGQLIFCCHPHDMFDIRTSGCSSLRNKLPFCGKHSNFGALFLGRSDFDVEDAQHTFTAALRMYLTRFTPPVCTCNGPRYNLSLRAPAHVRVGRKYKNLILLNSRCNVRSRV